MDMGEALGLRFSEEGSDLEEFLRAEAGWYASLRMLFQLVFDVNGGLAAQQYGLVVDQARQALHAAVDAKLIRTVGGRAIPPRENPLTNDRESCAWFVHRWQQLNNIWGADAEIVREMWQLEVEVPVDDGECIGYVRRCMSLVAQLLGFPLDLSRESMLALLRRFFDSAEILGAFKYARRDSLRAFGAAGYRSGQEADLYEYVAERVHLLWPRLI